MRPSLLSAATFCVSLGLAGCSGSPGSSSLAPLAAGGASDGSSNHTKVHFFSARAMPIGQSAALCAGAAPGGPVGKGRPAPPAPVPPAPGGPAGPAGPAGPPVPAACAAFQRTDLAPNATLNPPATALYGLQPGDLAAAYGISSATGGTGQTVAVVVAFDNPQLPNDLATYRSEFGMPACTIANGCLSIVLGKHVKPSKSVPWAAEADLDVEMVSAVCPNCKIMVAEAPSDQIGDLATTVTAAVAAGATVVSNSYSVPEDPTMVQYDSNYAVPGVPMVAGAGDGGFGTIGYPASSPNVTAVGGTTLNMSNGVVQSESAWSLTTSGCSAVFAKPSWQTDTGCSMRTANDVAVVADPNTGVATYMSGLGGWNVFGGTSVSAPIVAAMYALDGNGSASALYQNASLFRSIQGSTGTCSPAYLCTASTGYNGPAGLGTPYGLAAF